MMARVDRWMPLTGVVAVALWIIGVFVLESVSPDGESGEEILAYLDDEDTSIFIGAFLIALGTAFFLWFVGILRAALYAAEGPPGRLTAVAFAGAIGKAVFDMGLAGATAGRAPPGGRGGGASPGGGAGP